ncbi:class I SAM-dependent methyltransferase [Devosia sp. FJ2-5-3]|jgi:SAM-dependent methyltransferase|uniref:SAM-dependent methyltransferase n=1 Tax=Devosia sp. FJ2-5-3 TaxID=2976680 RepID=UPI0023D8ADC4|nr:class I SAM-dependent methyltransferase [Devosia sp. FJ2-5-3]WEJ58363.1 class I SAM-dependent methyltransferase [Devosia sp. FJ2-5-3]
MICPFSVQNDVMTHSVSPRIAQAIAALPLRPDLRVLEIGCGPGVAARLVSLALPQGFVLAIDRSEKAIAQARSGSAAELVSGRLAFRCVAVEDFVLDPNEQQFDLAFALRVGALDGRHPELGHRALGRLKAALTPEGRLHIDDRPPLYAAELPDFLDSGPSLP